MERDDVELIQSILSGDEAAFSILVNKYQKSVHALAWRKIGDFHIAEEITQDTFLQAHKKLASLKNPDQLAGWLYVITDRLCKAWFRKRHLYAQSLETTSEETLEKTVYANYVVEQREEVSVERRRKIVQKLLEKLPESERTVMVLHYLGEMSCEAISKFLGVSPNTVKSRLQRARKRLKNEESIIRETLGSVPLRPNLTENIMRSIDKTKQTTPSGAKPFSPLAALGTSAILVILLMGASNQIITNFQQPYSVDAESETTIEIVDAPIVLDIQKPELQNRVGNKTTPSKNSINGLTKGTKKVENNLTQDAMQWNLPEDAKARLGKGYIADIQYSPDGKFLAVPSGIGIWLYDVTVHQEASLITGYTGIVLDCLVFSPDGRILASGNVNGTIVLHDRITGEQTTLIGHQDYIICLAFSPDGQTIASVCRQGTILLWDAITGEEKYTLTNDLGGANLSFTPDGQTLVSMSRGDKISLWNSITGEHKKTFAMHPDCSAIGAAFSPDGITVAVGSANGTVYLYDLNTGEHKMILSEHKDHVASLAFSPDGKILATASFDEETICLWDVHTGAHRRILTEHPLNVGYGGLAFSPDGKTIASGGGDGTIRFWDAHTGDAKKIFSGHSQEVRSVAFNPNGNYIASGCASGIIRLWDAVTRQPIRTLNEPKNGRIESAYSIVFSPDGKTLFCGTGDGIHLWDAHTGEHKLMLTGHTSFVDDIALSSDGNILASGSRDNTIRLWDAHTGEHKRTLIGHKKLINSIAFSPDGKILASGSDDRTIRLWDVATGKNKMVLTGHKRRVQSLAFSPDGKILASGDTDEIIHLWDINTVKTKLTLSGHTDLMCLAFSPNGKTLTSGCADGTIHLWDAHTGEHKKTLMGHTAWVNSIAFSPDGKTLVSGSNNGSVLLWEIDP